MKAVLFVVASYQYELLIVFLGELFTAGNYYVNVNVINDAELFNSIPWSYFTSDDTTRSLQTILINCVGGSVDQV